MLHEFNNPILNDYHPNYNNLLTKYGIDVKSENLSMRIMGTHILYSFNIEEAFLKFKKYVTENNIKIYTELNSTGARFPYQIVLYRIK